MNGQSASETVALPRLTMSPAADPVLAELAPTSHHDGWHKRTGAELKQGAALNTLAMLASNFRAIFTLLIARILGPVALGIYSVAWATLDVLSKIGVCGLDDAVT